MGITGHPDGNLLFSHDGCFQLRLQIIFPQGFRNFGRKQVKIDFPTNSPGAGPLSTLKCSLTNMTLPCKSFAESKTGALFRMA